MSEPDDLFTLRNHFWLGSYQLAIAEGSGLGRLPDSLRIERDEFIYRSYVALGQYSIVLNEVRVGACAFPWWRGNELLLVAFELDTLEQQPPPFKVARPSGNAAERGYAGVRVHETYSYR